MERWQAKMIALVGIFLIPFVCTILPCKVSGYMAGKGEKGKKILSCLMCFGGGVFFATYVLHMGPEARDILYNALEKPYHINYPVADLLMGVGFFIVFYIEKLVIKINKRRVQKKKDRRRQQCLQFNKLGQYAINTQTSGCPVGEGEECNYEGSGRCQDVDVCVTAEDGVTPKGHTQNGAAKNACPLLGTGECCNDPPETRIQETDCEDAKVMPEIEPMTEEEHEEMEAHFTRSLVLLLALSLHRIFEGMSVGLQTSIHAMANLFLAVMCHETVIGFSLGLQFVKNKMTTRRIILASFLCSTIMPIGVAIGTMIIEMGDQGSTLVIVNGVLQSLATGTFIYVTFFEILQEEISPHDTSLAKVTSVLIGFIIMAALSAVPEEANPNLVAATTPATVFLNMSATAP